MMKEIKYPTMQKIYRDMYAICISRTRCFVKYSDRTLKIFRISIPKLSKLTQEYYQCHVCVDCQIEDVVHNEWEIVEKLH
jgi:hypothetical protein